MAERSQSSTGIVLLGDGQCESPGKCAKLCTYTLMEKSKNTVFHSKTVDKREVQSKSPNMESKAVLRALSHLKQWCKHGCSGCWSIPTNLLAYVITSNIM